MLVSCFIGIGTARYRIPTDLLTLAVIIMGISIWIRALAALRGAVNMRAG
jgi:hypothetical protein